MGCMRGCTPLLLLPLLVCCCAVGIVASSDQRHQEETRVARPGQETLTSEREITSTVADAEPQNRETSTPLAVESFRPHVGARTFSNEDISSRAPGYDNPQGLPLYPDYSRAFRSDVLLNENHGSSGRSYPDRLGKFDPKLNQNLGQGGYRNRREGVNPSFENRRRDSLGIFDEPEDSWGTSEGSSEGVENKPDGSSRAVVPSIELTPDPDVVTISDIQRLGDANLDRQARDYYDSAADQEQTLRENVDAFSRLRFRPRVLVDVSKKRTATRILGREISMPIGISPTAMHQLAHPIGEVGTARAAEAAGTVMILSTLSTTSLEDVRRSSPNCLLWYQLYVYRNRSLTESLVKRAVQAGYAAIVVTADSPVFGERIVEVKNGFILPPNLTLANLEGSLPGLSSMSGSELTEYVRQLLNPAVTWEDITWLKKISGLPIVLKGIATPEAAAYAETFGAAAILVSNHGGRELDGIPATIEALPEIVAAIRGHIEVYMDGGVRQGSDVAKALSLGAKAVFVGRPALWGLAYNGTEGVAKVLDILRTGFERTIALLGCPDSTKLTPRYVVREEHYSQLPWRNSPRKEF